jgi:hypothetical protein
MIFLIIFGFTIIISYFWVNAIDNMKKNHPNYKGEDLFDEEDNIHVS